MNPTRRAFLAVVASSALLGRCGSRSGDGDDQSGRVGGALASGSTRRSRPPLPDVEPLMRVRVYRARGRDAAVTIGAPRERLRLVGPALDGRSEVVVTGPVQVGMGRRTWSIRAADGGKPPTGGTGALDLERVGAAEGITLSKRRYPGALRLVARSDLETRAFDVVNHVGMESYLPGVVAGELYNHWRTETRAAQAVAARSFATCESSVFASSRAYDVTNTASSQVYLGIVNHRDTLAAVRDTRGVVLAYGGLLVSGYYSSCCGGLAALATDAIGPNPINDTPPLRGRRGEDVCTGWKIARWTIERPRDELAKRFREYGAERSIKGLADLQEVNAIEVIATNVHGRPTRYAINGSVELSAESLRRAASASTPDLKPPARPLWSSHLDVEVTASTVTFHGHGYGHGVGLCQHGAETLARRGKDHREILRWYYPDVEIVKAY